MSRWKKKKLSEFCEFSNGLWTGKKPPFQKVGVIRNTNFTKDCQLDDSDIVYLDVEQSQFQKRKLNYGDIILEKSGGGPKQPVGRVVIFDKTEGDFSFSNFTSVIRIKKQAEVDFNFLHRYLVYEYVSGATEKMQNHSTGIRNLKFDEYKEIEIPLPPLPEQQRIVSILDQCFAAIDKAKANAEQNLKNANELFESYLQGVFEKKSLNPDSNDFLDTLDSKNQQKSSNQANQKNQGSDNKQGWEHTRLGDICQINDGTHFSPKNTSEGEYMYVTAKNIKPYYIDLSNISYVSEKDHKEIYSRCSPKKGDVLYIKDGATAGIATINTIEEEFSMLSSVALLKCSDRILNTFLVHYMNSNVGKKNFLGYLDGAAITRLTLVKIKNVCFPLPPFKDQQTIVRQLDALRAETQKLEAVYQKKIADLEELKKSILQKAFAGELKTEKAVAV